MLVDHTPEMHYRENERHLRKNNHITVYHIQRQKNPHCSGHNPSYYSLSYYEFFMQSIVGRSHPYVLLDKITEWILVKFGSKVYLKSCQMTFILVRIGMVNPYFT
jgi:hypothetical protein